MSGLKDLSKKQLIKMIYSLANREVIKIKAVKDPTKKLKKPRVIEHTCNGNCCPNPDDHYHYVDRHEMGQA